MGRPDDYNEEFNELDLSALKEIGNIISGSYLSALSTMTNMCITSSVPYLAIDMAGANFKCTGNSVWTVWRQCTFD